MKLRWTPVARIELEEAVEWYDAQIAGLGEQLLKEVAAASALVERFPLAWRPLSKRARGHRLNRFPYSLIYTTVLSDIAVVVAFAHQQRKPAYWRDRLRTIKPL